MREIHNDEKIAIFVVSITVIIIIVILIVTNSIDVILKKYKKDNLVSCSSSVVENVVKYKNISCTVTDDDNKSYIFSYPEFLDTAVSFKSINALFREKYNVAVKNIEYHEDNEIKKYKIYKVNELNYKVIKYLDYLFVIDISNVLLDNNYRYDYNYNINIIDIKTKARITQDEFLNRIKDSDKLSSNLRKKVFDIYNTKFKYNFDYEVNRVEEADKFYDNLTISNINTFYYDASGRLSFILYLYDINKSKVIPYFFKANSLGDVTYSDIFS